MSTYDIAPTLEQMQKALDALRELRVAPMAVYAFATALDADEDAKEVRAEDPVENAGYTARDAILENAQCDLEDPRDGIIEFWNTVGEMRDLIEGEGE
jgi:hypothetical protein